MTTFNEMIVLPEGAFHMDDPPVEGARRVWGIGPGDTAKRAGWLMPQIGEVHPKTARWQRHMARYARKGGAA